MNKKKAKTLKELLDLTYSKVSDFWRLFDATFREYNSEYEYRHIHRATFYDWINGKRTPQHLIYYKVLLDILPQIEDPLELLDYFPKLSKPINRRIKKEFVDFVNKITFED